IVTSVIDHDSTIIQSFNSFECVANIICKNASLQTVIYCIGFFNGFVYIIYIKYLDYRAENFFLSDFCNLHNIGYNSWCVISAITITSCKNCYTIIFTCFIHYFFYTNRFFFCYEWSHISCFILFISHSHALCLFDKLVYKLVIYRLFYKNPLHPDTVWPTAPYAPETQPSTAASISASFKIIVGELEPSSILSFFSPAFFAMLSPVFSPPVNDTILILGCVINVSPISLPLPVITDRILSGSPASTKASAKRSALT